MARKDQLRQQRSGTAINVTSKKQESDVIKALLEVETHLNQKFSGRISIAHKKQWHLKDIVAELRSSYPDTEFHYHLDSSSIRPDGGILHVKARRDANQIYPI